MTDQTNKQLRTREAAELCGVAEGTMRWWRHIGYGPRSYRVGRKLVMYRVDDVHRWLDAQYSGTYLED